MHVCMSALIVCACVPVIYIPKYQAYSLILIFIRVEVESCHTPLGHAESELCCQFLKFAAFKRYSNMASIRNQSDTDGRRGFDCEFVEPPPDVIQTECPVCLLTIREPHQVTCCGYSFCRSCIQRIKDRNKPCPTCKKEIYSDFPDTRLKLTLNCCKVRCSHQRDGCEWTGELGQLDTHVNEEPEPEKQLDGCQFVEINCLYECGHTVQRLYMQKHQIEHCTKRPFSCEHCHNYESNYDNVLHNHWPMCGSFPLRCPNQCGSFPPRQKKDSHVENECPLTIVDCDFHHVGCTVKLPRKDMPEHLRDKLPTHMSLLVTSHAKQQAQIAHLTAEIERLKDDNHYETMLSVAPQPPPTPAAPNPRSNVIPVAPPLLIMTKFEKHKKNEERWHSPPVYTHQCGYKICLRVDANGVSTGRGSHVSVHVIFLRGEFDDNLKWPFRGLISIQLVDQAEGTNHAIRTMIYDQTTSDRMCDKVTRGEMSEVGLGIPRFIAHTDLKPRYKKQDLLFFQIYRVELK